MTDLKDALDLANSLDSYDGSGGSAPGEAANVIRELVEEVKRMRNDLELAPIQKITLPNGSLVQVALVLLPNIELSRARKKLGSK